MLGKFEFLSSEVLPPLRQMWYCVCDVHLPIAQKICRRDYLETLRECDPNNGWLPAVIFSAINILHFAPFIPSQSCLRLHCSLNQKTFFSAIKQHKLNKN